MALNDTQIQQLYTAYLGRPADQAGINYWKEQGVSEFELRANLANDNQPEYVELYGDRTREELVTAIYQNMFGREPEEAGLEYWVNGDGASVPASELQQLFISAASEEDTAAFNAKVAEDLSNVTPLPGVDETIRLTQRADDLQGADGSDTTFVAPVTQNETGSGALANTFETGDVLDGGANSTNTLRADLIATGTIQDNSAGAAISAETTNVQNVFLRAQAGQQDNNADNTTYTATIDAEKMQGVQQWWTDGSRADVRIEDVRSRPVDTTLGMRETDPEVGYEVYFNPLFMEGGQTSESQLVIQIAELDGGVVNTAAELANISVNALSFELDGEAVTLSSDAMAEANTWEELETAIVAALEEEGLGDLQVTRGQDGQFLLFDAEGRAFSNQGGFTASATTDEQIDIRNRITQDVQTQDEQTETTLVLDGAGNGSRGGDVNIAAMSGDRGVEVFNVVVDRSSHLNSMRSENNPRDTGSFAQEQQLEEVYLTHLDGGAQGMFQLGARTVEQSGVSTTIDDRLETNGLQDVRVFDATGYAAAIKLGASLTEAVFDKYLAAAEEPVQFSYLLGDAGNNLSLAVNNEVASDPDFALEIIGGDGDDRVNLTDLAVKNTTTIDLEEGSNTVEINTTTGAGADADGNYEDDATAAEYSAAQTAFAGFENVDRLVIADSNNTRQNIVDGNMTAIDGQEIVIATDLDGAIGVNTDIVEARIDTALTISGKNQTLGSQNNNNDQEVGIVNVFNTRPVEARNDLDVTLDNTARLNGELTVAELNVGTEGAGSTSAVSVLDLTSAGRRDTSNLVQSATLAGVNTVNLDGTQDLDLHIADMATGASVVDGSELGGDLDLAINGGLLTGATDVLTGTAAATDTLAVYGGGAQATVTGFETVQLGLAGANQFNGAATNFSGTFNAAAVSGVEQYNVVALDDATTISNLTGSEVVNVTTATADEDLMLIAADRATSNEITVNFDEAAGNWANGVNTLSVQDYRAVTLGLEEGDYNFQLDLVSDLPAPNDNTYARTLNVVGGTDDAADTSLDIGLLDTALTTVDLSGFVGNLVDAQWATSAGTNATVVANAYNFRFDVQGDNDTAGGGTAAATDFITRFDFDVDADEAGVVWQIDNFQVFGAGFDLTDQSIIDLRDLGVDSAADIVIQDAAVFFGALDGDAQQAYLDQGYVAGDFAAGDTVVTSNEGLDFTILLNGVLSTDLVNENFAGIA